MSLSARAEDMYIDSMELNDAHHVIEVSGHFSTPCVTDPQPKLQLVEEGVLLLTVNGSDYEGMCVQVLGPQMAIAIDLKALKKELQEMRLDTNRTYKVINPKTGFEETIDFSSMLPQNFSSIKYAGAIVKEGEKFYIEVSQQNKIEILSPFIALSSVEGARAEVFGHVVSHNLSENTFLMSMNTGSQLLLTGVSITAE